MSGFVSNPKDKDPERAISLQRYLVLHSQQESLRQRLLSPVSSPKSSRSSSTTSLSSQASGSASPVSATRRMHSRTMSRTPSIPRHASMPDPIPEEDEEDDEHKLFEVNQQIKATLIKLMHCASVRNDRGFGSWVSERLTDIDIELSGRRRNSG